MTTQLLHENAQIDALLRKQTEAGLSALHHPIERLSTLLSRPTFLVGSLLLFVLWITINLGEKLTGHRPWDQPPFYWLQGAVGLMGLVITGTVLVSQARQGQLAEQRAQLQLQVILLTEQRSAKLVGLLEELRRDLPNVRDRYDEQAQAMQETAVPQDILNALETADGTTPERTEQSDTRADGSSPHE